MILRCGINSLHITLTGYAEYDTSGMCIIVCNEPGIRNIYGIIIGRILMRLAYPEKLPHTESRKSNKPDDYCDDDRFEFFSHLMYLRFVQNGSSVYCNSDSSPIFSKLRINKRNHGTSPNIRLVRKVMITNTASMIKFSRYFGE